MIEAVLFDAAGTLIEPAEPVAETYSQLLSPHLGPLDPAVIGQRFPMAFRNAGSPRYAEFSDGDTAEREWWRSVVESSVSQTISDLAFRELFDHYSHATAWRVFPEVEAALRGCHKLGWRCAVVSNFDLRLHQIIRELKLGQAFEFIMTSADARARKPSALIFQAALRSLALRPEQVAHVGDSESADVQGASALGIRTFLVKRPERDLARFMKEVRMPKGI